MKGRRRPRPGDLYYYRARYYDPKIGRFISEDPIGFLAGMNIYAYVENNPATWIDPYGLDTYIVNRQLGGNTALPPNANLSHTFVATTDPNGIVDATFSWGNKANPRGWNRDQDEDIAAAMEAIEMGWAKHVSGSDLDPKVEQAFDELNKKKNEHRNLGVTNNCKSETKKLIDQAMQYP